MNSRILINAQKLTKQYGDLQAVKGIDFHIYQGECFGFLGPNGAGKTTMMKMMYCVLPVTSGTLTVNNLDVMEKGREIKRLMGVAPQENNLDPDFTPFQNLVVYARYFDISSDQAEQRADELLKFVNLEEKRDVVIEQLSAGMKRRLILARALINDPMIMILDEPTTGLDPQARHLIWDKIRSLQKQGVTIILTTHYMDEAAQLCDRIIIMDQGNIIERGSPDELIQKHIGEEVLEVVGDQDCLKQVRQTFPKLRVKVFGEKIHVFSNQPRGMFIKRLEHVEFQEARIRDANLEDVFLKLTGHRLRE